MGLLLDLTPEGREPPDPVAGGAETAPSQLERGLLGVPRYPLRALGSLRSAIPNIQDTPFGTLPGAGVIGRAAGALTRLAGGDAVIRPDLRAPTTSFNGRVTPHRRVALGGLDLDRVKAVKNAHGATVNDVVVAICAGAVRRWLIAHDELPDKPLVAQIPVSVRTTEQIGSFGNRILLMSAPLFTDEPDPVVRLQRTHAALANMKERHSALPADLLADANHFIPPAVFARAAGLTFSLATSPPGRPTWNLVIFNVPGAQVPLYCAGARLVANYPISVVTDAMGLNITVMSYCGRLDVGIIADRDLVADVQLLIGWLENELVELEPRAGAATRRRRPAKRAAPARRTTG